MSELMMNRLELEAAPYAYMMMMLVHGCWIDTPRFWCES